jgi:hypothetical protein
MASHRAGGGINSNKVIAKPQPKYEPLAKAVKPGRADEFGQALAYPVGPIYQGKGFNSTKAGQPNNMVSGPGGGRTVMASGTQGTHGPVRQGEADHAPDPPATRGGKDILREFGPESK